MVIWTKQISFKITLLSSNNLCTCQSWSLKCFRSWSLKCFWYSLMVGSLLFLYIMTFVTYPSLYTIPSLLKLGGVRAHGRIIWIAFPNFLRWISKIKVKVKIKLKSPGLLLFYIRFGIKYSLMKSFQILMIQIYLTISLHQPIPLFLHY